MNHFSPVCVAAWACVMPLMVQARERCMTWEDNMRAQGIRKLSATQKPQEGPSTLFRVDLSL